MLLRKTRSLNSFGWVALAAVAAGTAQGCSASTEERSESTSSTASAVGPEGQFPAGGVGYTIGIQEIDVLEALDLPSLLSYDQGYVEWGELGVRVDHLDPVYGNNVKGPVNAVQCDYGGVSQGSKLTNCSASPSGGGLWTNGPLELPFVVHSPTDTVNVGIALDNIEQNAPGDLSSGLAPGLSAIGNWTQAAGGMATLAGGSAATGAAWAAGPVIGIIGSAISLASGFAGGGGGKWVSPMTCYGGLLGNDPVGTQNVPTGNNTSLGSSDTLYVGFTPQDLEQRTLGGTQPATYELDVSVGRPGYYCWSSHKIILQITRDWTTGPAVSPKSGDSATINFAQGNMPTSATSTPGSEIDAFFVGSGGTSVDARFGFGTAWSAASSSPADPLVTSTLKMNPIASISRGPGYRDAFWFTNNGVLQNGWWQPSGASGVTTIMGAGQAPSEANLSVAARTPNHFDVFYIGDDGALNSNWWDASGTWSGMLTNSPSNIAQPGGGVAAVSRRPDTLDVLYTGNDGAVWWSSWSQNAGWQTTPIAPAGTAVSGGSITMVAQSTGQLDGFFLGANGAVYRSTWSQASAAGANHGWQTTAVTAPGVANHGSPISAVSRLQGSIDVAFLAVGNGLGVEWITLQPSGSFSAPVVISPASQLMEGPVSIVASSSTNLDAYYYDFEGNPLTSHWSYGTNSWSSSKIPIGPTSIHTRLTGTRCVDATGNTDFTRPQLWDCVSDAVQTWTFESDGTLRNSNNGKCLDANGVASNPASAPNGTIVQLYDCWGGANQQWTYDDSSGEIRLTGTNKCLDANGTGIDATPLQIWDCWGGTNQRWTLAH